MSEQFTIDCRACGGSGFTGYGTGYDDVCDTCSGYRRELVMSDFKDNTVELIGTYGGDDEHALSAWCSTERVITDERRLRMGKMLHELATNEHYTPFEKSKIHFLVRSDKASHIHIIKHRIGVEVNAESARYKELKQDDFLYPHDWPTLEEAIDDEDAQYLREMYMRSCDAAVVTYHTMVEVFVRWKLRAAGYNEVKVSDSLHHVEAKDMVRANARKRAKESARFVLPHAHMLTQDVSFNFRSFMHFLHLRLDPHAQVEIQRIACRMLLKVYKTSSFHLSLAAFGYTAERIETERVRLCVEPDWKE